MDFFVKCPTVRERILDREDRISAKQMEFKRKAAKTGKHFYQENFGRIRPSMLAFQTVETFLFTSKRCWLIFDVPFAAYFCPPIPFFQGNVFVGSFLFQHTQPSTPDNKSLNFIALVYDDGQQQAAVGELIDVSFANIEWNEEHRCKRHNNHEQIVKAERGFALKPFEIQGVVEQRHILQQSEHQEKVETKVIKVCIICGL